MPGLRQEYCRLKSHSDNPRQVPEINSIKIPNKISFESGNDFFHPRRYEILPKCSTTPNHSPTARILFWSLFSNQDRYLRPQISHDNLHIRQNLTVCQLLLCDPPNCQNSLTKLKFLMLYSIVDKDQFNGRG